MFLANGENKQNKKYKMFKHFIFSYARENEQYVKNLWNRKYRLQCIELELHSFIFGALLTDK